MKFKFFTVPIMDSDAAERAVNEFCAAHAVTVVEKHGSFIVVGAKQKLHLLRPVCHEDQRRAKQMNLASPLR